MACACGHPDADHGKLPGGMTVCSTCDYFGSGHHCDDDKALAELVDCGPDKPQLIGIITLPLPRIFRNVEPGVDEMISRVAFDTHGRAWGLVMRMTKPKPGRTAYGRMTLNRFQLLTDIPFEHNPVDLFDKGSAPLKAEPGDEEL